MSDGSTISTPVVLNATGPYSSAFNALAFAAEGAPPNDMKVTTRPLRNEVAYVRAPPGLDYDTHGMVMTDLDAGT